MKFYYENLNPFNSDDNDSLFVEMSVNGGVSFTTLRQYGLTDDWKLISIGFISTSPNTIIKFKGKGASYTYTDIYIDEVSVVSVPCITPENVFTAPTPTNVQLTIVPSPASSPAGYEYAVTTSNVAPSSGTYTTSPIVNVTGLNPADILYYVYARSVCSGTGNSSWFSTSFTTATANCIPQYTQSCSGNGEYNLIKGFDLKGENSSAIHVRNPTCSSNYIDYTSSTNATLAKGKAYSCIINVDTMNYFSLWIDYNDNNAFTINEKILDFFPSDYNKGPNYVSFFIPSNALAGTHKMRLRMNSSDPCTTSYYGQANDYTVTITENNLGSAYNVSPGMLNTCARGSGLTISATSNNNNEWIPLTDSSNNIIASINANGNDLGIVNVYEYVNGGAIRKSNGKPYLDRNPQISVQKQPSTNVSIRIYLLKTEYDALRAADPGIKSLMDLWLTKTAQACGSTIGSGLLIQPVSSGTTGNGYYVEYSIPGFSSFYLQSAPSALPVTVSSLSSKRVNNTNHLSWTTQSEQDNVGFDIEMSLDGTNFKKIAFVESRAMNGNSSGLINYTFDDDKAYPANTYYRLKQVTKDGKIVYSNIVMIAGAPLQLQITSVFPNPVSSSVTLNVYSQGYERVSVIITTTSGKAVLNKSVVLQASANNVIFNTSSLQAGTYFVKMISAVTGIQSISKFVKL